MSRQSSGCLLLFAVLAASATPASAEDAEALIKRGVELRRAGHDQEALEQFRRAYEIAATPRALAQIGLAEQAVGAWVDAEQHIGKALAAARDPWIAKNRTALEAALATVAQHLGSLEIVGEPPGAEIRIDGQLAGKLPLAQPLRVSAGSVVVEVRAPAHLPTTRTVMVAAAQLTRERVWLQPAPKAETGGVVAATTPPGPPGPSAPSLPPPAPPPPPPAAGRSALRTGAWVTLWAGAAAAAAGVTSLIIRQVDAVNYNDNCVQPANPLSVDDQAQCKDWQSGGSTASTVAAVTWIGAGALGVASGVLFYLSSPARATETRLGFACLPDLVGVGVTCAARF